MVGACTRSSKPRSFCAAQTRHLARQRSAEFINWIANNPLAGDVIPGTSGLRKMRWSRAGMGKRGGARVIYYNMLDDGEIWLLIAYTKAKFDNLPASFLNQLREEIDRG